MATVPGAFSTDVAPGAPNAGLWLNSPRSGSDAVARLSCNPVVPMVMAILVLLAVVLSAPAYAADPLFADDSLLEITVTGPFARIDKERDKEQEYEGSLTYTGDDGQPVTLDAKFSVRGNFRLRKDVCSHAQLWVNLKKGQAKETLFDGQNKIKLVMQCKDADRYQEYLAREHQAYLMYQELTDYSLDTRLLRVTYVDSDNGKERTKLGFFIQHQNRLAKEYDMQVVKTPGADRSRIDPEHGALVAVYMYLLSNTDYSMISSAPGETCCHNIKVLEAESGTGPMYPIPDT